MRILTNKKKCKLPTSQSVDSGIQRFSFGMIARLSLSKQFGLLKDCKHSNTIASQNDSEGTNRANVSELFPGVNV